MEPKKNAAYDVHRYRPALFAGSLAFSLVLVIILFEWSVEVIDPIVCRFQSGTDNQTPPIIETILSTVQVEKPVQVKRVSAPVYKEVKDLGVVQQDLPNYLQEVPLNAIEGIQSLPSFEPLPAEVAPEDTFRTVEKMPMPIGGMEAFFKMLQKHMKYPRKAQRTGTEGRVFIEFTISKSGFLTNFKVIKGLSQECDEEARRVLALTEWEPGKQRGVPVNVRMVQQINFQLQK